VVNEASDATAIVSPCAPFAPPTDAMYVVEMARLVDGWKVTAALATSWVSVPATKPTEPTETRWKNVAVTVLGSRHVLKRHVTLAPTKTPTAPSCGVTSTTERFAAAGSEQLEPPPPPDDEPELHAAAAARRAAASLPGRDACRVGDVTMVAPAVKERHYNGRSERSQGARA
jgi:hypothetical protein